MSLRLWLIGGSPQGSPSPAMQEAALRACGIGGEYSEVAVDASGLEPLLERLRRGDADGANVTVPHKLAAAALCDELEGDAALLGAVNTLVVGEAAALVGANTDAGGLEAALRAEGLLPSSGGAALVVGAGGAALGAGLALARCGIGRLAIAARRQAAAAAVAERLAPWTPTSWHGLDEVAEGRLLEEAAIVVNATGAGASELPLAVDRLAPDAVLVDLRYRPRPVDLVAAARARGLRAGDGMEMLLRQGMLSLRRWTGVEPPLEAARAALLGALGDPAAAARR